MFDIATFYDDGRAAYPAQAVGDAAFACRVTLYQYRLPYETTLRYLRPGDRVLDWGCGGGHFSYFLLKQQAVVTGYSFEDPPAWLLDHDRFAHVRGRPEEPRRLPFDDASFDCVFSMAVLEHVHETGGDELASLAEIKRVLKPGGYFLCFHFPNQYGPIEPLAALLGVNEHFHQRKYRTGDVRRLVDQSGFTLLESGRYNFLPRNSLRRLPEFLRDREPGVRTIDLVDTVLSKSLPVLTQNHYFVAQKPAGA